MKKVLTLLLLLFSCIVIFAQANNPFTEGKKLYDSARYEAAEKKFLEALDVENKRSPIDRNARANVYNYIGLSSYMQAKFNAAIKYYHLAVQDFDAAKRYKDLAVVYSNINSTYKWADKYNTNTLLSVDSSKTEEFYFPVTSIIKQGSDTVILKISAGSTSGISKGTTGYVMLSYNSTRPAKTESNYFVAKAEVIKAGLLESEVMAIYYTDQKAKDKTLYIGDLVNLKLPPPENKFVNILYDLAALNVLFLHQNRDTILTQASILRSPHLNTEKHLLNYYLYDIHDFYEGYMKDYKDSSFTKPFTSGRFKGYSINDVFRIAEAEDLYAFFNFVRSYPAKYMGKAWKLNETYATWLLNNMYPGEPSKWLIPFISQTSESKIDSFAYKFDAYLRIDSMVKYVDAINDLYTQQNYHQALSLSNKLIRIATILKEKEALSQFVLNRSYVNERLGYKEDALADAKIAYQLDTSSLNAAYNLGYLYAQQEKYDSSFVLLEPLANRYTNYPNITGNLGWYKILAGQLEDAKKYSRNAYLLDTTSYSWAVNYGHTFLLSGNNDTARKYYQKTLDNLYTPADYTEGPKKDFETFFKNGWKRVDAAVMLEWMDNEYNRKYKLLTEANVIWDSASRLYKAKKYMEAAEAWHRCIKKYESMEQPHHLYIHNAITWIASCHKSSNNYSEAEKYYLQLIEIDNSKLNDPSVLIDDYSRLFDLYTLMGNAQKAREYKLMYDVQKQKLDDLSARPDLYIVSIEGQNIYQPESKLNARTFSSDFSKITASSFDTVHTHYVAGSTLSSSNILQLLTDIKSKSKPEDVLVFYYTGSIQSTSDKQNYLVLDTTKEHSTANKLYESDIDRMLKDMSIQKKLVIMDVPAPGMLSKLSQAYSAESYALNEVIFICPGVLTPVNSSGLSAFTEQLLQSANELAKDSLFTAKQLLDKASYGLGRGKYYLPVLSFAYAKDFTLYKNEQARIAEESTRGAIVRTKTGSNAGQNNETGKNYALLIATNDYQELSKLSNPIYDANELGKILKEDFGFDTSMVINGTRDEMENILTSYRDNKIYGPNDQLFIFFAGHGVYSENAKMGYLAAKDSRRNDPNFRTYLSYSDLGNLYLKNINCNRVFVVLDACFAGTFFDQSTVRGDEPTAENIERLKRNSSGKKYYKGISSGAKEYVPDGRPGQHSPFAASFISNLVNKAYSSKVVTGDLLIATIKSNPPSATSICDGKFQYSDPTSHFIFELKTSTNAAPIIRTDTMRK